MQYLEFEKPIADLQAKIDALKQISMTDSTLSIGTELSELQKKSKKLTEQVFAKLTDWQIIQVARHPDRPYTLDYLKTVFDEFDELHGDRSFADDAAIVGGLAKINNRPVMVIGQQKGRTTKEKLYRNFGMPHPEGYRKALRLMRLAERFELPVVTLIDTPGAYPGINAEARGQSEAIATNLEAMAALRVPIICVVIGEGCSGGALGIGVGDKMLMMQYSYFATISPEGCASILWRSAEEAPRAAEVMGITAEKLKKVKLVDDIIKEPVGGAHRDLACAAKTLSKAITKQLDACCAMSIDDLLEARYQKIMQFGNFSEA